MAEWIGHDFANQVERLSAVTAALPAVVGLDTEFMRVDTFAPKLALIQIEFDGEIALIDPLADVDFSHIGSALSDPARTCIMHSASEDLEALIGIAPQGLGSLYDTQIAAAFAGMGAGLSYQKLVHAMTGIELEKGETRSDWLRRPLSPKQLEYAAHDVEHLPEVHAQLGERLKYRGFVQWHAEDCARMLERARDRTPDTQPQVALRSAANWSRERQALLRRVLLWREATIRIIDKPRPWLLDDAHALDFASNPPRNDDDLYQRGKGLRALRGPQRADLLRILSEPLRADELEFEPIPAPLALPERKIVTELKQIISARASELDVPEGLLCARRHLESLLTTRHWPTALDGWRREVLHDALMTRLGELTDSVDANR